MIRFFNLTPFYLNFYSVAYPSAALLQCPEPRQVGGGGVTPRGVAQQERYSDFTNDMAILVTFRHFDIKLIQS